MEQEKKDRKTKILNITREVHETAKNSYQQLEDQGVQLKKTGKDLRKIGEHVTVIDKNLVQIEKHKSGRLGYYVYSVCCCVPCKVGQAIEGEKQDKSIDRITKNKQITKMEEHLSPERIEKEWNARYDPEERWIQQVETGLDCLLKIAEHMKKSFDDQNKLAEQIYFDAKVNRDRMKDSQQKMKAIQGT